METFNALLTLSELKAHYSEKPVGICPLYKGSIGATKAFETAGNPVVIPKYVSLEKLAIDFSPKQSGSGDPSPENVRPITGWDSVKITVSRGDESHDYDITLPETIYGGTVDAVTGEGSAQYIYRELAISDMDNFEDFPGWRNAPWINEVKHKPAADGDFATLGIYGVTNIVNISQHDLIYSNGVQVYTTPAFWGGKTQSQIKEAYPDLVVQFCLKLVNPEPFKVSKISIPSLGSENNFFTNGENLDIIYKVSSFWG